MVHSDASALQDFQASPVQLLALLVRQASELCAFHFTVRPLGLSQRDSLHGGVLLSRLAVCAFAWKEPPRVF